MDETPVTKRSGGRASGMSLVTAEGRTTIADGVVAKIAAIAAREVAGVHELLGQGVGDTITGLAQRVTRTDTRGLGVRVDVEDEVAIIDLRMTTDYGVSIVDVADAVRRNIIDRAHAMTGLSVREVNIEVVDLYFPDEEPMGETRQAA